MATILVHIRVRDGREAEFEAVARELRASDQHEAATPRLGELIADMKLEWVDPIEGGSLLPPTTMQPLRGGADALSRRYHLPRRGAGLVAGPTLSRDAPARSRR